MGTAILWEGATKCYICKEESKKARDVAEGDKKAVLITRRKASTLKLARWHED